MKQSKLLTLDIFVLDDQHREFQTLNEYSLLDLIGKPNNKGLTCCRYVEGGMGSVSLAISKAAREAGVHIMTNAEVCFL